MSIGLWTKSGSGSASLVLSPKYEGVSSLMLDSRSTTNPIKVERKYFACQSFRVTYWSYLYKYDNEAFKFVASDYGEFEITQGQARTAWVKRRVTFLWDTLTESKWFRLEQWDGQQWNLVKADTCLGSEEPGLSTFAMLNRSLTSNWKVFVDAVECEVIA